MVVDKVVGKEEDSSDVAAEQLAQYEYENDPRVHYEHNQLAATTKTGAGHLC